MVLGEAVQGGPLGSCLGGSLLMDPPSCFSATPLVPQ